MGSSGLNYMLGSLLWVIGFLLNTFVTKNLHGQVQGFGDLEQDSTFGREEHTFPANAFRLWTRGDRTLRIGAQDHAVGFEALFGFSQSPCERSVLCNDDPIYQQIIELVETRRPEKS